MHFRRLRHNFCAQAHFQQRHLRLVRQLVKLPLRSLNTPANIGQALRHRERILDRARPPHDLEVLRLFGPIITQVRFEIEVLCGHVARVILLALYSLCQRSNFSPGFFKTVHGNLDLDGSFFIFQALIGRPHRLHMSTDTVRQRPDLFCYR